MGNIIGLTGYAQVGKDTLGAYLVERYGFQRFGLADVMKECMYNLNPIVDLGEEAESAGVDRYVRLQWLIDYCGWDGAKLYDDVRRLLQKFGTDVVRNTLDPDLWVRYALNHMEESENYVVTDVRFVNEAHAIHAHGGHIWRIERPGYGPANEHESEQGQNLIQPDVVIQNDGGFEKLYGAADKVLTGVRV